MKLIYIFVLTNKNLKSKLKNMKLKKLKSEIKRLSKLESKGFINDIGQVKLDNYKSMLFSYSIMNENVINDTVHTNSINVDLKQEKEVKKNQLVFSDLFGVKC